jgi:hypothetical protein
MAKDKLLIGLQAGLFATIFKEIGGFVALWAKAKHTYWDYAAVLILQHRAETVLEYAFAVFIQAFFSMSLAVFYAYTEVKFPTRYPLIKGSLFGGGIWMIIQAAILLFKVQDLHLHSINGAIMEFVVAVGFGVIVSWWVDQKIND